MGLFFSPNFVHQSGIVFFQMTFYLVNQCENQAGLKFVISSGNAEGQNYVALGINSVFQHVELVVQLVYELQCFCQLFLGNGYQMSLDIGINSIVNHDEQGQSLTLHQQAGIHQQIVFIDLQIL